MPHHLQPARRQAPLVAVVEPRGDGVLHEVVEGRGLEVVAVVGVVDAVGGGDRPAVAAVVPLVPPPVEDRQVQSAVERGLHARRPARLERPQRVVEPDVAARVQRQRHRDVVVRQEHDAVPHGRVVGEPDHLLDEPLARLVGRVRLARDDELDGPLRVQQQLLEPLGVAQHEREPLVRRHPAGETDRQDVGVEHVLRPGQFRLGRPALQPRQLQPPARVLDEPAAQDAAGAPDLLVGDLPDLLEPQALAGQFGTDVLLAHREHLGRHPRRRVHAVGDRGDRDLGGVETRPEAVEHAAADGAVQLDTPFARCASRNPMTAMLKTPGSPPG